MVIILTQTKLRRNYEDKVYNLRQGFHETHREPFFTLFICIFKPIYKFEV